MSAFNDLNGIPASGNHFTLTQILRDEWEFDGFVVSDWESMEEMIDHGFCKDMQSVAYKSVTAGVDMEMVSDAYWTELKGLVEQGVVSEELVDERVANILRIKLRKGLFDRAFTQNDRQDVILSEPHLQLTRKLAQQSFVLLKNRDHTLPLSDSLSIAMIGPLADAPRDQMGTWAMDGRVDRVVTPRQAFQERLENDRFHYAPGLSSSRDTSHAEFDVAVTAAEQSDAVVMILGEEQILSGEAKSRAFLDLPGAQAELFAAVAKTGKPVITVIMAGRPLTFAAIAEKSDAVLYAWHPGTLGGPALADVLFGDVSPSGKLTTTFPRTVGQIPIYYNHRSTGRPPLESELGIPTGTPQDPRNFRSDYLDVDFTPAYPFGYGLSYTSFRYDNLVLSSPSMSKTEQIIISAEITNTGSMPGTEIVQLYIQDRYGSITRPVRELKGFQRVTLNPGESQTVSFELNAEQCSFYAMDNTPIIEPGTFSIWVAKDAASGLKGSFRITEK
ncbi:MAG: glycoside hydrolase family 3 C-terminal domain-containing protein [candidate division KSB1 bacterium]|nr:glycoside hydrolase family 3 C-terminal domain-containing protein [candidate division KSB1 bacterium]